MESEDSDTDMSEDEADEDACGHMDKENQQPNDPPVSDYVAIEPQQHLCPIGSEAPWSWDSLCGNSQAGALTQL